jgi:hypothetical protein
VGGVAKLGNQKKKKRKENNRLNREHSPTHTHRNTYTDASSVACPPLFVVAGRGSLSLHVHTYVCMAL